MTKRRLTQQEIEEMDYAAAHLGDSEALERLQEEADHIWQVRGYPSRNEYGSSTKGKDGSIVVPKNWGILNKDLTGFDKNTLENIFYGVRNLWIPVQILDIEQPSEIIANYLAAGSLKRYNGHKINRQIPRSSFTELVKYMNRVSYDGFPVFRRQSHKFKKREDLERSLEKRFEKLSPETKREFCASFFLDYKPSILEEPNNPYSFWDPQTQRGYANQIYKSISNRFVKEHSNK